MPWIRTRVWWSIRPYAAGRRTTARHCGPARSCRTRRTSTARPAVAGPRAGRPTPPTRALRVRDVDPRGGDARRGRARHPPPGAGRRARHARRSRVTPAPPDAPPPGEVCGDGVASVDDRYACAAGGRLSLGRPGAAPARRRVRAWRAPRPGLAVWSAWAARLAASGRAPVAGGPRDRPRGCPRGGRGPCRRRVRRRRAARRASHAPHGRLSACSVGTIRQPVIVVCVFAMRRSSDIGMVTSIAMVTYIGMVTDIAMVTYIGMVPYIAMVASIWRVA